MENILDQIEDKVEGNTRAGKQNAERRTGLDGMANKYRSRMDNISTFIAKAIADKTRGRGGETDAPLPQVQVQSQKKAWKVGELSLQPKQLVATATVHKFNRFIKDWDYWTLTDPDMNDPSPKLLYAYFLSVIEEGFKMNLERE